MTAMPRTAALSATESGRGPLGGRAAGAFWGAFASTAGVTLVLAGGLGWGLAKWLVDPPPERYKSSVFEFELPKGWACQQEGTESVCRKGQPPSAAVCILTMKYRGPQDGLATYRAHLSAPQPLKHSDGQVVPSTIVSVDAARIGGRDWIVGRHLGSEVENYFTDYYAGLTSHVAILVTFSVHQRHVAEYEKDIRRMVKSLKVYQPDPLNR